MFTSYGYLEFRGKSSSTKYSLLKRCITFGDAVDNDIRIHKRCIEQHHARIVLKPIATNPIYHNKNNVLVPNIMDNSLNCLENQNDEDDCSNSKFDYVLETLFTSNDDSQDSVKVNGKSIDAKQSVSLSNGDILLIGEREFVLNTTIKNVRKARKSIQRRRSSSVTSGNSSICPKPNVPKSPLIKFESIIDVDDDDQDNVDVTTTVNGKTQYESVLSTTTVATTTTVINDQFVTAMSNFETTENNDNHTMTNLEQSAQDITNVGTMTMDIDGEDDEDSHNSTYSIEADKSVLTLDRSESGTPISSKVKTPSKLKSLLKLQQQPQQQQPNKFSSVKKSVKFNRFIEENHMEIINSGTGGAAICKSTKISKKLFSLDSSNDEENTIVDVETVDDPVGNGFIFDAEKFINILEKPKTSQVVSKPESCSKSPAKSKSSVSTPRVSTKVEPKLESCSKSQAKPKFSVTLPISTPQVSAKVVLKPESCSKSAAKPKSSVSTPQVASKVDPKPESCSKSTAKPKSSVTPQVATKFEPKLESCSKSAAKPKVSTIVSTPQVSSKFDSKSGSCSKSTASSSSLKVSRIPVSSSSSKLLSSSSSNIKSASGKVGPSSSNQTKATPSGRVVMKPTSLRTTAGVSSMSKTPLTRLVSKNSVFNRNTPASGSTSAIKQGITPRTAGIHRSTSKSGTSVSRQQSTNKALVGKLLSKPKRDSKTPGSARKQSLTPMPEQDLFQYSEIVPLPTNVDEVESESEIIDVEGPLDGVDSEFVVVTEEVDVESEANVNEIPIVEDDQQIASESEDLVTEQPKEVFQQQLSLIEESESNDLEPESSESSPLLEELKQNVEKIESFEESKAQSENVIESDSEAEEFEECQVVAEEQNPTGSVDDTEFGTALQDVSEESDEVAEEFEECEVIDVESDAEQQIPTGSVETECEIVAEEVEVEQNSDDNEFIAEEESKELEEINFKVAKEIEDCSKINESSGQELVDDLSSSDVEHSCDDEQQSIVVDDSSFISIPGSMILCSEAKENDDEEEEDEISSEMNEIGTNKSVDRHSKSNLFNSIESICQSVCSTPAPSKDTPFISLVPKTGSPASLKRKLTPNKQMTTPTSASGHKSKKNKKSLNGTPSSSLRTKLFTLACSTPTSSTNSTDVQTEIGTLFLDQSAQSPKRTSNRSESAAVDTSKDSESSVVLDKSVVEPLINDDINDEPVVVDEVASGTPNRSIKRSDRSINRTLKDVEDEDVQEFRPTVADELNSDDLVDEELEISALPGTSNRSRRSVAASLKEIVLTCDDEESVSDVEEVIPEPVVDEPSSCEESVVSVTADTLTSIDQVNSPNRSRRSVAASLKEVVSTGDDEESVSDVEEVIPEPVVEESTIPITSDILTSIDQVNSPRTPNRSRRSVRSMNRSVASLKDPEPSVEESELVVDDQGPLVASQTSVLETTIDRIQTPNHSRRSVRSMNRSVASLKDPEFTVANITEPEPVVEELDGSSVDYQEPLVASQTLILETTIDQIQTPNKSRRSVRSMNRSVASLKDSEFTVANITEPEPVVEELDGSSVDDQEPLVASQTSVLETTIDQIQTPNHSRRSVRSMNRSVVSLKDSEFTVANITEPEPVVEELDGSDVEDQEPLVASHTSILETSSISVQIQSPKTPNRSVASLKDCEPLVDQVLDDPTEEESAVDCESSTLQTSIFQIQTPDRSRRSIRSMNRSVASLKDPEPSVEESEPIVDDQGSVVASQTSVLETTIDQIQTPDRSRRSVRSMMNRSVASLKECEPLVDQIPDDSTEEESAVDCESSTLQTSISQIQTPKTPDRSRRSIRSMNRSNVDTPKDFDVEPLIDEINVDEVVAPETSTLQTSIAIEIQTPDRSRRSVRSMNRTVRTPKGGDFTVDIEESEPVVEELNLESSVDDQGHLVASQTLVVESSISQIQSPRTSNRSRRSVRSMNRTVRTPKGDDFTVDIEEPEPGVEELNVESADVDNRELLVASQTLVVETSISQIQSPRTPNRSRRSVRSLKGDEPIVEEEEESEPNVEDQEPLVASETMIDQIQSPRTLNQSRKSVRSPKGDKSAVDEGEEESEPDVDDQGLLVTFETSALQTSIDPIQLSRTPNLSRRSVRSMNRSVCSLKDLEPDVGELNVDNQEPLAASQTSKVVETSISQIQSPKTPNRSRRSVRSMSRSVVSLKDSEPTTFEELEPGVEEFNVEFVDVDNQEPLAASQTSVVETSISQIQSPKTPNRSRRSVRSMSRSVVSLDKGDEPPVYVESEPVVEEPASSVGEEESEVVDKLEFQAAIEEHESSIDESESELVADEEDFESISGDLDEFVVGEQESSIDELVADEEDSESISGDFDESVVGEQESSIDELVDDEEDSESISGDLDESVVGEQESSIDELESKQSAIDEAQSILSKQSAIDEAQSILSKQFAIDEAQSILSKQFAIDEAQSILSKQFAIDEAQSILSKQFAIDEAQSILSKQFAIDEAQSILSKQSAIDKAQSILSKQSTSNEVGQSGVTSYSSLQQVDDVSDDSEFDDARSECTSSTAAMEKTSISTRAKTAKIIQTPKADYIRNVDYGIKKLAQPRTPAADYKSNVDFGIKKLSQPKTPKADYKSKVDFGIKKLTQPKTPLANYDRHVNCIKSIIPMSSTPLADYDSNVEGIKRITQAHTPKADFRRNVNCIKSLYPVESPQPDYEANVDGIKLLTQAGTPKANFDRHVNCIKSLYPTESPQPDYEANVDGIKQLMAPTTPKANFDLNVSTIRCLFLDNNNHDAEQSTSALLQEDLMITPKKTSVYNHRPATRQSARKMSTKKSLQAQVDTMVEDQIRDHQNLTPLGGEKPKTTRSDRSRTVTRATSIRKSNRQPPQEEQISEEKNNVEREDLQVNTNEIMDVIEDNSLEAIVPAVKRVRKMLIEEDNSLVKQIEINDLDEIEDIFDGHDDVDEEEQREEATKQVEEPQKTTAKNRRSKSKKTSNNLKRKTNVEDGGEIDDNDDDEELKPSKSGQGNKLKKISLSSKVEVSNEVDNNEDEDEESKIVPVKSGGRGKSRKIMDTPKKIVDSHSHEHSSTKVDVSNEVDVNNEDNDDDEEPKIVPVKSGGRGKSRKIMDTPKKIVDSHSHEHSSTKVDVSNEVDVNNEDNDDDEEPKIVPVKSGGRGKSRKIMDTPKKIVDSHSHEHSSTKVDVSNEVDVNNEDNDDDEEPKIVPVKSGGRGKSRKIMDTPKKIVDSHSHEHSSTKVDVSNEVDVNNEDNDDDEEPKIVPVKSGGRGKSRKIMDTPKKIVDSHSHEHSSTKVDVSNEVDVNNEDNDDDEEPKIVPVKSGGRGKSRKIMDTPKKIVDKDLSSSSKVDVNNEDNDDEEEIVPVKSGGRGKSRKIMDTPKKIVDSHSHEHSSTKVDVSNEVDVKDEEDNGDDEKPKIVPVKSGGRGKSRKIIDTPKKVSIESFDKEVDDEEEPKIVPVKSGGRGKSRKIMDTPKKVEVLSNHEHSSTKVDVSNEVDVNDEDNDDDEEPKIVPVKSGGRGKSRKIVDTPKSPIAIEPVPDSNCELESTRPRRAVRGRRTAKKPIVVTSPPSPIESHNSKPPVVVDIPEVEHNDDNEDEEEVEMNSKSNSRTNTRASKRTRAASTKNAAASGGGGATKAKRGRKVVVEDEELVMVVEQEQEVVEPEPEQTKPTGKRAASGKAKTSAPKRPATRRGGGRKMRDELDDIFDPSDEEDNDTINVNRLQVSDFVQKGGGSKRRAKSTNRAIERSNRPDQPLHSLDILNANADTIMDVLETEAKPKPVRKRRAAAATNKTVDKSKTSSPPPAKTGRATKSTTGKRKPKQEVEEEDADVDENLQPSSSEVEEHHQVVVSPPAPAVAAPRRFQLTLPVSNKSKPPPQQQQKQQQTKPSFLDEDDDDDDNHQIKSFGNGFSAKPRLQSVASLQRVTRSRARRS